MTEPFLSLRGIIEVLDKGTVKPSSGDMNRALRIRVKLPLSDWCEIENVTEHLLAFEPSVSGPL